jgi:hypothetical protein
MLVKKLGTVTPRAGGDLSKAQAIPGKEIADSGQKRANALVVAIAPGPTATLKIRLAKAEADLPVEMEIVAVALQKARVKGRVNPMAEALLLQKGHPRGEPHPRESRTKNHALSI